MMAIIQVLLPLLFVVVNSQTDEGITPPIDLFPIEEKLVEYGDSNDVILEGFLVYPTSVIEEKKSVPAVIVFHSFAGRSDFEELKAKDLASLGYVAFSADLYGRGVASKEPLDNYDIGARLVDARTTTLRTRVLAAWETVKDLHFVSDVKIGCIGFSLGGLACLDLARFNVGLNAAVSFHGILENYPGNNSKISTSIQVHEGYDDMYQSWTEVTEFLNEMEERDADCQLNVYSNTTHGFTMPDIEKWGAIGLEYDEKAERRSRIAMLTFLAEKLWDIIL